MGCTQSSKLQQQSPTKKPSHKFDFNFYNNADNQNQDKVRSNIIIQNLVLEKKLKLENERLKLEQLEKERQQACETQNNSQLEEIEEKYEQNLNTFHFLSTKTTMEALLESDQFHEQLKQKNSISKLNKKKRFDLSTSNQLPSLKSQFQQVTKRKNQSVQIYPTFNPEKDSQNIMNMSNSQQKQKLSKNKKKEIGLFSQYIVKKTHIQNNGHSQTNSLLKKKQSLHNILNQGLSTISESRELQPIKTKKHRKSIQIGDNEHLFQSKSKRKNSIFYNQQAKNTNSSSGNNNINNNNNNNIGYLKTQNSSSNIYMPTTNYTIPDNDQNENENIKLSQQSSSSKTSIQKNQQKNRNYNLENLVNSGDQAQKISGQDSQVYFDEIGDELGISMQKSQQVLESPDNDKDYYNQDKHLQFQQKNIFEFDLNSINQSLKKSKNLENKFEL